MANTQITRDIALVNMEIHKVNRERIAVEKKRTDLLIRRDALYLEMNQSQHRRHSLVGINGPLSLPGTLPVECAEIDVLHWESVT